MGSQDGDLVSLWAITEPVIVSKIYKERVREAKVESDPLTYLQTHTEGFSWVRGAGSERKSISNHEHNTGTTNPKDMTDCTRPLQAPHAWGSASRERGSGGMRVAATKWEE